MKCNPVKKPQPATKRCVHPCHSPYTSSEVKVAVRGLSKELICDACFYVREKRVELITRRERRIKELSKLSLKVFQTKFSCFSFVLNSVCNPKAPRAMVFTDAFDYLENRDVHLTRKMRVTFKHKREQTLSAVVKLYRQIIAKLSQLVLILPCFYSFDCLLYFNIFRSSRSSSSSSRAKKTRANTSPLTLRTLQFSPEQSLKGASSRKSEPSFTRRSVPKHHVPYPSQQRFRIFS